MPQTDPNAMNAMFWNDVSLWLTYLWIYFPLIIIFAFCMLIAHGLIPSGVRTGTYPAMFSRLRIPLTVIGVGALAGAVVMMNPHHHADTHCPAQRLGSAVCINAGLRTPPKQGRLGAVTRRHFFHHLPTLTDAP